MQASYYYLRYPVNLNYYWIMTDDIYAQREALMDEVDSIVTTFFYGLNLSPKGRDKLINELTASIERNIPVVLEPHVVKWKN